MKRGKQTCKILKDIRRQIAEANDIEFITSECQYQGDCLGTCPKCEAEVRYLEQQLERKRIAGKAVTVLGISAGLVAMSPMTSCTNSANKGTNQEITNDTISNECMFGDIIPITKEDTIVASIKDIPSRPEPGVLAGDIIEPVEGEVEIEGEISEDTIKSVSLPGWIPPKIDEMPSENDTLHISAVMPEFPGGAQKLMSFIARNIQYPKEIAQGEAGAQGRVIVQFIVDKDGNIINPRIVRGVDPYLDKEALRVVNLMPKWKPGELEDGTKVAVYYTIPVMFRLQ
ncbi:energy transducer TonB [Bacteroides congonensis]